MQMSMANMIGLKPKVHRVLIVDDQEAIRNALRGLLSAQSSFQTCGEAHDGREAVQMAVELDPEVILMDISMPGLDGLEATRRIRKILPRTEILIFSQHESLQAVSAAKSAGARGFLAKSDAVQHLVPALETVCQHIPFFPLSA
jgi:DNA-binding NarL/FixJ family response regulator